MFAEHKIIMPAEKSSLTKKLKLTGHDCRFCENIHFKSEEDLQKHFKDLPILHKNNSAYDRNPYRCEIGHSENWVLKNNFRKSRIVVEEDFHGLDEMSMVSDKTVYNRR